MKKTIYLVQLVVALGCSAIAFSQSKEMLPRPSLSQLVPEDKKLDSNWVKGLTSRGMPEVCTGSQLDYIDMPVSGLFTGQVTLGGDGGLYSWDIFNDNRMTGWSGNYGPIKPSKPLQQYFTLTVDGKDIPIDRKGFSNVSFLGEYPIGKVTYQDKSVPVEVTLKAFSPFIPLNVDDAGLPLTTLNYTIKNTSNKVQKIAIKGFLENFVMKNERGSLNGKRINKVINSNGSTVLEQSLLIDTNDTKTEDLVIEDWSGENFSKWTLEGNPFNGVVLNNKKLTNDQKGKFKSVKAEGGCFISTYNFNKEALKQKGKMQSQPFTITHKHLYVWMRNYSKRNMDGVFKVLVEGKVVGQLDPMNIFYTNSKNMFLQAIDLSPYQNKTAVIELTDNEKSNDAAFVMGKIFLSDKALLFDTYYDKFKKISEAEDIGNMGLALIGDKSDVNSGYQETEANQALVGMLGKTITLKPGESQEVSFAVAWYFPNLTHLPVVKNQGRWYAFKFNSMREVVDYLTLNKQRLYKETEAWHDRWYASTLPHWLLNRTIIPVCNLAASTNYRLKDGRWWAWEGIGSCEGTCGHVYGYAQAVARLFPQLERELREKIDFNLALNEKDGSIDCRGENKGGVSIDAQGLYILRALRDHQMTTDSSFLKRIYPKVKLAMEYMIRQDSLEEGVIRGKQHNTLDADWHGEVSWYNGIYLAALKACAEMAAINSEPEYAKRLLKIADKGAAYMTTYLFNGEYYQNKIDSAHLEAINSGSGSEIDQVLGQSWAFQVGLPRVLPQTETKKSLASLWKYNFTRDAGAYRKAYNAGRRYADVGESGLLMCTFPKNNWDFYKASGIGKGDKLYAGYFNECMTGFEHQVAGHMIWEGMLTEGLAIEKAIHDRYAPAKRNPYNEVECGDYYGRAMASYGVYIAACGFEYDGPSGKITFAPKIQPENFKSAFTAAKGWGSFSQSLDTHSMKANLEIAYGTLSVKQLILTTDLLKKIPTTVRATLDGKNMVALLKNKNGKSVIVFEKKIVVKEGKALRVVLE